MSTEFPIPRIPTFRLADSWPLTMALSSLSNVRSAGPTHQGFGLRDFEMQRFRVHEIFDMPILDFLWISDMHPKWMDGQLGWISDTRPPCQLGKLPSSRISIDILAPVPKTSSNLVPQLIKSATTRTLLLPANLTVLPPIHPLSSPSKISLT
jgi:hypothetical protein